MKLINKNKPHYFGHRERMRKKILSNVDSMPDYELLEVLLFYPKFFPVI